MSLNASVRNTMLATLPRLRAFAVVLCRNIDQADDLVQATLLRALTKLDSFQPGSNMTAWLCTILLNQFRTEYRKRRREVEDSEGIYADTMISQPARSAPSTISTRLSQE